MEEFFSDLLHLKTPGIEAAGMLVILVGVVLAAADIIDTVAIEPSLESVALLAGIIVIRTFLSVSLEVEIEGHWPWRRGKERKAEPS
ncbi:DUF1622 domain-containing protein (plasmid) [Devosia neptuniae]|uniref:DUF1622 domain-containing protein n=1 Tax=Devosia neptuniae TaxID=191302 RepID=A0ABY6C834_9HYPH|nr:DUF1622 domain-containing protein [Devosia neptuniae]UXN68033.1 DUF1622 domain-containing protein [Devosia neptuniae]